MKLRFSTCTLALAVAVLCALFWQAGQSAEAGDKPQMPGMEAGAKDAPNLQVVAYASGLTGFFDPVSQTMYVYASDLMTPYLTVKVDELGKPLKVFNPATGARLTEYRNGQPVWEVVADEKLQIGGNRIKPRLDLDGAKVELTVMQRETRAIPGSHGTLAVRLGDITEGQVLVSVTTSGGLNAIDRKSMKQGDRILVSVDGCEFQLELLELRNLLAGDDWARFLITGKAADEKQ